MANIKTLVHNLGDHSLSVELRPAPTLIDNESAYLLRVHAVALTNGELLWPEASAVPGFDVSGVIIAAPEGGKFKVGDAVYGLTDFHRPGAAREQQVALESELGLKPQRLTWEEAASVSLSALTAWQSLFVHAGLSPPGSAPPPSSPLRVLIIAASGGAGVWLVQLAHLAGAYVVGTCGPTNVETVKALGADEVLDYTKTTLQHVKEKFDVVVDCKGGDTLVEAWSCVRDGGFINSIAEPPELRAPESKRGSVRSKWFIVEPDGSQLEAISELIESGKCRAFVDSVWPLEEYGPAMDKVNSFRARGKVVLKVS